MSRTRLLGNMPHIIHSVHFRLSAATPPPSSRPSSFPFFFLLFIIFSYRLLVLAHYIHFVCYFYFLTFEFPLYLNWFPILPSFLYLCFFILFILSPWLIRRYFFTLSFFSHSLPLPLNCCLPLLLATSLVFSALLDLISLPLVSLSHLHSHDAFFAFLFLSRIQCSLVFFFYVFTTAVELFSLLYLLLFLILVSDSFLLHPPFDPHRTIFLFFFFRSIFFFRMVRRFIPLILGRFKISQILNAFKRERFEYKYENIGKIIY